MENNYRLTITLEDAQGGAKSNPTGGERSSKSNDKNAEKLIKQVFGYKAIKSNAEQALSYYVSTVQLRTGSTEAQQRANFTYGIGMQTFNFVESTVAGFKVGNAVGAVVGALMSVTQTALSYAMKQNTLNMQSDLERSGQVFAAQRATYSGSRYQRVIDE